VAYPSHRPELHECLQRDMLYNFTRLTKGTIKVLSDAEAGPKGRGGPW
jgi:hypothetical protein